MALHMAMSPVAALASVHCAAATENFMVLENHSVDQLEQWSSLVEGLPVPLIEDGHIAVPEGPGLGFSGLNEEVLQVVCRSRAAGDFWSHRRVGRRAATRPLVELKMAYDIAVLKGDGIGPEVMDEALKVLNALGTPSLAFAEYPCGAGCYLEQGDPLPEATVEGCRRADAVLLGAMGLPHVRWPDGTEMRPQVDLRIKLDLYAGVRPIYLYAAAHTPLKGLEAGDIDFVILRENVEGLFASMNGGIQLRGEVAVDSMVITRTGTERVVRYAFELARQRGRTPMKVTCVDKANVFRSMAFFRSVYDEVAR